MNLYAHPAVAETLTTIHAVARMRQTGNAGRGFLVREGANGTYRFEPQLGANNPLRRFHSSAFADFDSDCLAGKSRDSMMRAILLCTAEPATSPHLLVTSAGLRKDCNTCWRE